MQQTTSIIISVLALVALSSVATMALAYKNTIPYGVIGQEDELSFYHDGILYINAVPSQGNGLFIAEPDIDQDYSIDQAISRFHIDEDITAFNVKPSLYSNVTIMYELDNDLQFQLTHIYNDDESGMSQEVQQY